MNRDKKLLMLLVQWLSEDSDNFDLMLNTWEGGTMCPATKYPQVVEEFSEWFEEVWVEENNVEEYFK